MLTGPDISNHQLAVNFAQVASAASFLLAKATESTGYADPWFAVNKAGARGHGLLFGAYHFARGGDPNAEASWFLAHADHQPGELLVLDWEIEHPTPDAWCAVFCSRLRAAGVTPVVYMSASRAVRFSWAATRGTGAVLWAAQYGVNDGRPHAAPNVGAWGSYLLWQYTSLGYMPGVPGGADVSFFYGDVDRWHALGGLSTVSAAVAAVPTVTAAAPGALAATAPTVHEEDEMISTILYGYTDVVGRKPSFTEVLDRLKQAQAQGETEADVVAWFLASAPEPGSVTLAFRALVGHDPSPEQVTEWVQQPTIQILWNNIAGTDESKAYRGVK